MSQSTQQPQMTLVQNPDYREAYANSVQVRVSVWDFQLVFGRASSEAPDQVTIQNHTAIFLSPQQAKALCNMLGKIWLSTSRPSARSIWNRRATPFRRVQSTRPLTACSCTNKGCPGLDFGT